uniref:C3H1-type domain-containing protein n=1 Tax=Quercus lobata TaxID=97700 RepID=A0A7N2RE89_QUELO
MGAWGRGGIFDLEEVNAHRQSKNRESVTISLGLGAHGGAAATPVSGPNAKPSNWKTRICHKWELTGYCPFGSKCHFAHGVAGTNETRKRVIGSSSSIIEHSLVIALPV